MWSSLGKNKHTGIQFHTHIMSDQHDTALIDEIITPVASVSLVAAIALQFYLTPKEGTYLSIRNIL